MKSVTLSLLQSAANAFDFGGPVLCDAHHYGEGHINDTFVVWREDHSKRFILQRINTDTFTDPVGLMENVCGVTRHLRAKILAEGGDPARETLNVIPTLSGSTCYLDADGGAWRAYDFVEDTVCLQQVGSEADFRTVAKTLGKFQNQLADYPASTLHETIARFHDTPNRYANFEKCSYFCIQLDINSGFFTFYNVASDHACDITFSRWICSQSHITAKLICSFK